MDSQIATTAESTPKKAFEKALEALQVRTLVTVDSLFLSLSLSLSLSLPRYHASRSPLSGGTEQIRGGLQPSHGHLRADPAKRRRRRLLVTALACARAAAGAFRSQARGAFVGRMNRVPLLFSRLTYSATLVRLPQLRVGDYKKVGLKTITHSYIDESQCTYVDI